MNSRFTVLETSLNRAEFRWKWLRFLQHSSVLGSIVCSLTLLFGVAMARGGVTSKTVAVTFFAFLAVGGLVTWLVLLIAVLAASPDRGRLAAAIERVDRRLLDRLNTLLFLEHRRGDARNESFAFRIARQAQNVVAEKKPPSPFPANQVLGLMLLFVGLLTATVLLYELASPWDRMLTAERAAVAAPKPSDPPFDLALPATNNVEQEQSWGEVRITDPDSDLQVTKVDVVPLQIEAAANQSLHSVQWLSTVNGGNEQPHELPPPTEPRYAVYHPTLYLDELHLSDWDLMTYYAKADTQAEKTYASQVYFLEVRPFREDILKMPVAKAARLTKL
jgi:hypothetical protein